MVCGLFLLLCMGCPEHTEPAVEIREEGYDPFLLGPIGIADLEQQPYSAWYLSGYQSYEPDSEVISQLDEYARGKDYILFLGTWCSDSQREVPGMVKVLDQLGVSRRDLRVIAVDEREGERYKTTPSGVEKEFSVDLVPTLIVRSEGEELGRIVEYTLYSPEKDLLNILRE